MHETSKQKMRLVAKLIKNKFNQLGITPKLLDMGAVEPSYRDVFEPIVQCEYLTMNVDYPGITPEKSSLIVQDPFDWREIPDASYDIVISGQVFEHVDFFWVTMLEMRRILKPGGICAITALSHWQEHNAPLDCYRFYADGLEALARFSGLTTLYAYAEHPEYVNRPKCDAITVMEKPLDSTKDDEKYKKAHEALCAILPTLNEIEVSRNKTYWLSGKSKKWDKNPLSVNTAIVDGTYSFHTTSDDSPWYIIDLNKKYELSRIILYNRENLESRAQDLDIMVSDTLLDWKTIHQQNDIFGGAYDGKQLVLHIQNITARYVRVQKRSAGVLHLDQVKVFATL